MRGTSADSRLRRFEAIVLARRDWRENDRLVVLLGRDYGRFDAVAYGARKPRSRWAGKLDILSRLDILAYRSSGGELWTGREAAVLSRPEASEDWRRSVALQAGAELLATGSPAEETGKEAFEIAAGFAEELSRTPEPLTVLLAFAAAWSESCGFGLPETAMAPRARRFLERAASDPPEVWHRYRLPEPLSSILAPALKAHVEAALEREWKGAAMLVDMVARLASPPGTPRAAKRTA